MSYAFARTSAKRGSFWSKLVIFSKSSSQGEVKGWCMAMKRSSSSSHSSMGKLTTQSALKPLLRKPKSVPMRCRNLPIASRVFNVGPAKMHNTSPGSHPPGFAFAFSTHFLYCSSVKNFLAEQSKLPSFEYLSQTSALAFTSSLVALFSSSFNFLPDQSAIPLQHTPTTNSASSKILKLKPLADSVRSTNSMSNRRSGLSIPKRSIASLYSMR
mmetsp:Transcript_98704/g.247330  ORF Transcript_98704/g.247330 Transcript_98704/m.247330 type:complete len:213 (+) Transcript_98704:640-1278(+)